MAVIHNLTQAHDTNVEMHPPRLGTPCDTLSHTHAPVLQTPPSLRFRLRKSQVAPLFPFTSIFTNNVQFGCGYGFSPSAFLRMAREQDMSRCKITSSEV